MAEAVCGESLTLGQFEKNDSYQGNASETAEKARMYASPWKSGPSRAAERAWNGTGFSPCGRLFLTSLGAAASNRALKPHQIEEPQRDF
jgi:hypothetical protein